MSKRLLIAGVCYTILATLSAFTLTGVFRIGVWVVLGGLAVKTWIAQAQQD
jgi:hypothetical protein